MTHTPEQIAAMSDAELSREIALAMGWVETGYAWYEHSLDIPHRPRVGKDYWNPPGDMSQAWECEEYIKHRGRCEEYECALLGVCGLANNFQPVSNWVWMIAHTTPRQKSEACLLALQEIKGDDDE